MMNDAKNSQADDFTEKRENVSTLNHHNVKHRTCALTMCVCVCVCSETEIRAIGDVEVDSFMRARLCVCRTHNVTHIRHRKEG